MLVKITRVVIISLIFNCFLLSQTLYVPTGINGIDASTTGNVGIGTNSPIKDLDVIGDGWFKPSVNGGASRIYLGNWSYSSTTPFSYIEGNDNDGFSLKIYSSRWIHDFRFMSAGENGDHMFAQFKGQQGGGLEYTRFSLYDESGSDEIFRIKSNDNCWINSGNVGIGTTSPNYKLEVIGDIRSSGLIKANEIQVTPNGADFVFEPDYELPTLEEVETHIKEHKHLPDIPSAEEMQANGVNMGEMQTKLLQKIEELTLYTLQQQKEIEMLKKELCEIRSN